MNLNSDNANMSKTYGICMTVCDIIDEFNNAKTLQITDLVQILFRNDKRKCVTIKLMDEGPMQFGKTAYECYSKNITSVSNELVKYLVGADYWGRLDILRFKNKIGKLRVGLSGNLQVQFEGHKYILQYITTYIGKVYMLGAGFYVGIKIETFSDIPHVYRLFGELLRQFNYPNDQTESFLTVRVEQLFDEIELNSKRTRNVFANKIETKDIGTSPIQLVAKESPVIVDKRQMKNSEFIPISNIFEPSSKNQRQNANSESMNGDRNTAEANKFQSTAPQYSQESVSTITNKNRARNKEILKELDSEKKQKENAKTCYDCRRPGYVFKLSCEHSFCPECLWAKSEVIKQAKCPVCSDMIQPHQIDRLDRFLQTNLNFKKTRPLNVNNNNIDHTHAKNSIVCLAEKKKPNPKICYGCGKSERIFKFLCNHSFCPECVYDRLELIRRDVMVCPVCFDILKPHQIVHLNRFLKKHLEEKAND